MRAVTGFAFNHDLTEVILIKKNRPDWQAGCLNGVGGKIEIGELPIDAMRREFREETGVEHLVWNHYASLVSTTVEVFCYRAILSDNDFRNVRTTTDEEVIVFKVADILTDDRLIHNLRWLIPMAMLDSPRIPVEFEINNLPNSYRFVG